MILIIISENKNKKYISQTLEDNYHHIFNLSQGSKIFIPRFEP
jgi:hypothetical protein